MRSLPITWLLAGALVASLYWNVRAAWAGAPSGQESLSGQEDAFDVPEFDRDVLGLTAEQERALGAICDEECARTELLARETSEGLQDLRARLSDGSTDEDELRRLVREVSVLREEALGASVDAILAVRRILDPDQLRSVIEVCCRIEECTDSSGDCCR